MQIFTIVPLQLEGAWDRNKNFGSPKKHIPNWKIEEGQITKQRDFLN